MDQLLIDKMTEAIGRHHLPHMATLESSQISKLISDIDGIMSPRQAWHSNQLTRALSRLKKQLKRTPLKKSDTHTLTRNLMADVVSEAIDYCATPSGNSHSENRKVRITELHPLLKEKASKRLSDLLLDSEILGDLVGDLEKEPRQQARNKPSSKTLEGIESKLRQTKSIELPTISNIGRGR